LLDLRQDALPPVGVQARIDHDHEPLQEPRHVRVRARREVVRHRQRRVRSRRLVAVDAVPEPRHRRRLARQPLPVGDRQPARIGELRHVVQDRVEPPVVGRARDHGQHERPPLVRPPERLERQALARRVERAEGRQDLVVPRDAAPDRLPEQRLRRRHTRVVVRAGEEFGVVRQLLRVAEAQRLERALRVQRRRRQGDADRRTDRDEERHATRART
jgi:hypothetical protein